MMRDLIGKFYRKILKRLFFKIEPEKIHNFLTFIGKFLGTFELTRVITAILFDHQDTSLVQVVDGIKYRNPVGLAAGFDKDANLINIIDRIGFSYIEIGSITYRPYEGNPKPRLYRLKRSKGIVVNYGLKNIGAGRVIEKIKRSRSNVIKGISVAKTNCDATSTTIGGIEDYIATLKILETERVGDYYTINISCPNTFGGEPFTTEDKLDQLLVEVDKLNIKKPIYLKMPINLVWEDFKSLLEVIIKHNVKGVVIGNLTKQKDPNLILDDIPDNVKGGISGLPTQSLSDHLISNTYKEFGNKLTIIGVGGIFNADDAYRKIKLGASLVQLITGMIFEGPQMVGQINIDLVKKLQSDGLSNISEAIGLSNGRKHIN